MTSKIGEEQSKDDIRGRCLNYYAFSLSNIITMVNETCSFSAATNTIYIVTSQIHGTLVIVEYLIVKIITCPPPSMRVKPLFDKILKYNCETCNGALRYLAVRDCKRLTLLLILPSNMYVFKYLIQENFWRGKRLKNKQQSEKFEKGIEYLSKQLIAN